MIYIRDLRNHVSCLINKYIFLGHWFLIAAIVIKHNTKRKKESFLSLIIRCDIEKHIILYRKKNPCRSMLNSNHWIKYIRTQHLRSHLWHQLGHLMVTHSIIEMHQKWSMKTDATNINEIEKVHAMRTKRINISYVYLL